MFTITYSLMNPIFYKLTWNNHITYYALPAKSDFSGTWEKHYSLDEKYCTPMLDCTVEKMTEKNIFRFYDNPPYQETKEQEEEYNAILSNMTILFNKDLSKLEETSYLHVPMEPLNNDSLPEKYLLISTILI